MKPGEETPSLVANAWYDMSLNKEKEQKMISTIQQIDNVILNFIQSNLHFPLVNKIMPAVSWLGNNGAIWIAIAILLMISKKHIVTGLMMIGALVLCVLIGNLTLKPLIARIRPCYVHPEVALLIPRPTDFSFPSGHTMSSFAAATVLLLPNKRWGIWALTLAALITLAKRQSMLAPLCFLHSVYSFL